VAETGQAYAYTGDDPTNDTDPLGLWGLNPFSDATQAWNDTGGKVVSQVNLHRRGIAQALVTVTSGLAVGLCAAATEGACLALAPEVGCGVGALNAWIGGGGAKDISAGCGEGGLVGSSALLCAVTCGPVAVIWAGDLVVGGAQGVWDYANSDVCQTPWGYVKAFGNGAFNDAPIPWQKRFGGRWIALQLSVQPGIILS